MHCDTIVLGAGVAGLACASRLLLSSHNGNAPNQLCVLEARDRIGGRIGSVQIHGCRLDTGANWIHGTGSPTRPNPLMDILPRKRYRELKGSVLFQAPNRWHHARNSPEDRARVCPSRNGQLARNAHISTIAGNLRSGGLCIPADVARVVISSVQKAISEVQNLATQLSSQEAKHTSVLHALRNTQAFQNAYQIVPSTYHHTLSAMFQGIENMEAAPLLAQTTEPQRSESRVGVGLLEYMVNDYDGEQAFLQDGFVAIVDEIARPLMEAGTIALRTVVQRIDWTRNPIVIETNRGNYSAREVVCTFPLGVLKEAIKDTLFVPSLPADKQEAVEKLGFGTLDKIFAVYSTPWWNEQPYVSVIKEGLAGGEGWAEDDLPDSFLGFTSAFQGISIGRNGTISSDFYRLPILNLHALTGQPALGAFVSCRAATTAEKMDNDEIGRIFHQTLSTWFGIEPPKADAIHVTRWAQDPYSRGGYSHMITGLSSVKHRESFHEPLINQSGGVIRFAGEHCSRDHFAMVHGALLDGWRVADAMSRKRPRFSL